MKRNKYESPFSGRYMDEAMSAVFSDESKFTAWRLLWFILANEERKLGAPITQHQIDEIWEALHGTIDYEKAEQYERDTHHDVMAHLKLLGDECPDAKPILHLGVTSCYITDNADMIAIKRALYLVSVKLSQLIDELIEFARKHAGTETVAYTHFQVAQPTTVGKRACLWANDFITDLTELNHRRKHLTTLGCKGATGNMSGTLCLFDGDVSKARALDLNICSVLGIDPVPVSGQTYSRKQDYAVAQVLSGIAQSASKMATDIRLLSSTGELREGFGEKQVGSSAMPYKKNPIECEKIVGLSRYIIVASQNTALTASTQWLERTLDDSANRRVVIAEMFMAIAEVLNCCSSVVSGLVVDKERVKENLNSHTEMFKSEFATVMDAKTGGDRQDTHEKLREAFINSIVPSIKFQDDLPMRLSATAEEDVNAFVEWYEKQPR